MAKRKSHPSPEETAPLTPDEAVLERIRAMKEVRMHHAIIRPLLTLIGASHIEYLHGTAERGKDFKYILPDPYGTHALVVCQVKNSPFVGTSASENSFAGTVNQLLIASTTKVLNPLTGHKQLPDEVSLWTTYSIPERATLDAEPMLAHVKERRIRIIGPEQIMSLCKKDRRLFDSLSCPDESLVRDLQVQLSDHAEANAFDLAKTRSLDSFYINLALIPTRSLLHQIDKGDLSPLRFSSARHSEFSIERVREIVAKCACVDSVGDRHFIEVNIDGLQVSLGGPSQHAELHEALERLENLHDGAGISCVVYSPKEFVDSVVTRFRDTVSQITPDLHLATRLPSMEQAIHYLQVCDDLLAAVRDTSISAFEENFGRPEESQSRLRYPPLPTAVLSTLSDNLLLLGGPGAGKTSTSKRLVRDLLRAGIRSLFFPCVRITGKSQSLEVQIIKYLQEMAPGRSKSDAAQYLQQAQFIVLDGADEAASYSTSLCREIQALASPAMKSIPLTLPSPVIPEALRSLVSWDDETSTILINGPVSSEDAQAFLGVNRSPSVARCFRHLVDASQSDCLPIDSVHAAVIPAEFQAVVTKVNSYSALRFSRILSQSEIDRFVHCQPRQVVKDGQELAFRGKLVTFFKERFAVVEWPVCGEVGDFLRVNAMDARIRGKVIYNRSNNSIDITAAMTDFEYELARVGNERCIRDAISKLKSACLEKRRIIVTMRSGRSFDLMGFVALRLLPFSDSQLLDFFRAWFADSPHLADQMQQFLDDKRNGRIREIARTPMIATLMASLLEKGFDLPASKTEVYEKRFELLLGRWDATRDVIHRCTVRARDKVFLLSEIAFVLHKAHRRDFGDTDVRKIWHEKFAIHYPGVTVDALLDELEIANGVIELVSRQKWSLGHLSYQEYLAAFHIVRTQKISMLRQLVSDSWWRQVVVFCVGLTGDASPFVSSFLKHGRLAIDRELLDELLLESRGTPGEVVAFVEDRTDEDDEYMSDNDDDD